MGVVESVAGGLIVVGTAGAVGWLRHGTNRDSLRDGLGERLRRATCKHQWQPLDEEWEGTSVTYYEECSKCGETHRVGPAREGHGRLSRGRWRWPR